MALNCRSVAPRLRRKARAPGRVYGFQADPRTDVLPGRGPLLAQEEPARGLERSDAHRLRRAPARGLRLPAEVAAPDVRGRLRRRHLAQGVRRAAPPPPRGGGSPPTDHTHPST